MDDEAEETENDNSFARDSTYTASVNLASTTTSSEKSHSRTASDVVEEHMATVFSQLTNVTSIRTFRYR